MADTLTTLAIDYVSRGLDKVERDMRGVNAQAQQAKKSIADMEDELYNLRVIQNRNGSLTAVELKRRKDLIAAVHKEQAGLRLVEKTQRSVSMELTKRKNAVADVQTGSVSKVGAALSTIGNVATNALGAATAGITALVKAADPVGFQIFQNEMTVLAMRVGRIFIPILRDATSWIKQVSDWFAALSPEQRQQARDWTRIGLAVLGTVAAFAVLGKTLGFVIGVIQPLWALVFAHPFVALAAAIGLVSLAVLKMSGAFDRAGDSIKDVGERSRSLKGDTASLNAGRRASEADVRRLSKEDQARLKAAGSDPKKQKEVLETMRKEADEEVKANPEEAIDKKVEAVRSALEETKNIPAYKDMFGRYSAEGRRKAAIEEKVKAAGFSDEEAKATAERIANMKVKDDSLWGRVIGAERGVLESRTLTSGGSGDLMKETVDSYRKGLVKDAVASPRTEALHKKAVAEAGLRGGGIDKAAPGGKKVENDTPTVMPHTPELMGVAELWRKAQTSTQGTNDPRLTVQQELLRVQQEALRRLDSIDDKTHDDGLGP